MTPRLADPLRLAMLTLALTTSVVPPAVASPIYRLTDLGPLIPVGLNNSGQVVGLSGSRSFLYQSGPDAGRLEVLATLGGLRSSASAINDDGLVVGNEQLTGEPVRYHATLYSNGQVTDLGTLGGDFSTANGINAAGQVVGTATDAEGRVRPVLYAGGTVVDLGASDPAPNAGATAINDSGQAVGFASSADGPPRAVLYEDGAVTDLGTLGGRTSNASDINDAGQVVGYAETTDEGVLHAFLYSGGTMHDLGTLGGTESLAHAVNATGQVVGHSITADAALHAFLYSGGTLHDLNSLIPPETGWTLTQAADINDVGQIVGLGWVVNDPSTRRGFLLSPEALPAPTPPELVPEPTTLSLLGTVAAICEPPASASAAGADEGENDQ